MRLPFSWSYPLRSAGLVVALLGALPGQSEAQVWTGKFDAAMQDWPVPASHWGKENMSFLRDPAAQVDFLRVAIHKGGIDPASMRKLGRPVSGAGFKANVIPHGAERATLSYLVRFPPDFPFMRGGKLPGLYGGKGNGGGDIPDGTDGFSFRLMWLQEGKGRVYAYLPSSVSYGTFVFEGKLQFRVGQWQQVVQELALNSPGHSDGVVRLWLDGQLIGEQNGLMVRTVQHLKINGLFFDFFFGGNDSTWAASKATYADFADFKIRWQ